MRATTRVQLFSSLHLVADAISTNVDLDLFSGVATTVTSSDRRASYATPTERQPGSVKAH